MNAEGGNFSYPPRNSNLQFDYRDSVVTSWVTDDFYATQGVLSLWYWLLNAQINWTISVIEAVPANGSKSVALDIGVTSDYLGQFNLNYNTNDGIQRKYTSPLFTVNHDLGEISQTLTWNQQALSTTLLGTSSTSKLQAASTDGSRTTSATTSALTTTLPSTGAFSTTSNPTPHHAAAIGLGVGISFGIVVMGLIGFLFWKKKTNSDRTRSKEVSQEPATFVAQEKIMGEMDAHQKYPELSVGRLDAELDGGRSTL